MESLGSIISIMESKEGSLSKVANRLGVTRQLLYYIKNGERPLTERLRKLIIKTYPDLKPLVMQFHLNSLDED